MMLRDYRPSGAVDCLFRLAVSEVRGVEDDLGLGITLCIIALIDYETDGRFGEEEIGRHASRLMQDYVKEWMLDPW